MMAAGAWGPPLPRQHSMASRMIDQAIHRMIPSNVAAYLGTVNFITKDMRYLRLN